jgi:oxygen-independent coproporphyrinogen-3 oxidase
MYYAILEGHSYSYEMYEILSIFFPGDKIEICSGRQDIPVKCSLIVSRVSADDKKVCCDCSIYGIRDGLINDSDCTWASIPKGYNTAGDIKHAVKLSLFKLLARRTKRVIPWGLLVGIRPSKIVNSLKDKGHDRESIFQILKGKYLIRDDKANLVIEISDNSYKHINRDKRNISIYIGIPFCPTRCIYCSFASYPVSRGGELIGDYLDALSYEMTSMAEFINNHFRIETVYIGGGTPTSLNDEDFSLMLSRAAYLFVNDYNNEFTVEAGRPDTIDEYKLDCMREKGVNRISINPQTMNDATLKRVGREHTVRDIIEKYSMAREKGFRNINMDMILGLPGEDMSHVTTTIKSLTKLSPENITVHTMAVKRASKLRESLMENERIPLPEYCLVEDMMEYAHSELHAAGYIPYYMYRQKMMVGNLENAGYCKKGLECLYNIEMIEEKQTIIGMGADAVSKVVFLDQNRIERFANKKDIKEYIRTVRESTEKKLEFLHMLTYD